MSCLNDEGNETTDHQSEQKNTSSKYSSTFNSPKNPVSVLQEVYSKQGITPKYDLVQIEGNVHEPTFRYRVTIGEAVASGSGSSKKKAKHEAAKNILKKLTAAQDYFKVDLNDTVEQHTRTNSLLQSDISVSTPLPPALVNVKLPNIETDLTFPYDDEEISGDPIGELQELCVIRKIQIPVYEVNSSEGLPLKRYFVMDCTVGPKFRETASAKSKKRAKKKAAAKMLATLRMQPLDTDYSSVDNSTFSRNVRNITSIDEDDLVQNMVKMNTTLKSGQLQKENGLKSALNDLLPLRIKDKFGNRLKSLHDLSLDLYFSDANAQNVQEYLQNIAEEQGFKVTYIDVEERSKSGKYHCFVQMTTSPVTVCFGVGQISAEEARIDAARNTLEYLRIMTS